MCRSTWRQSGFEGVQLVSDADDGVRDSYWGSDGSTEGRGGARIFCLGGPNFVTNILVSSQDKPSHSDINAHTKI